MRLSGRDLLGGIAVAGLLAMVVIAMAFVARVGFLGIGIIGLLAWFICTRIELEKDAAVGSAFTPDLFARQIRAQAAMTRSEKAAQRQEQTTLLQALRFFKRLGIALAAIGFGMFVLYQL
jgi:hypothetical protein